MGCKKVQLGEAGLLFRDLSHLLSGSLSLEMYVCPDCDKMEFFHAKDEAPQDEPLPKRICPKCGDEHDFDYPKCPKCKFDYFEN